MKTDRRSRRRNATMVGSPILLSLLLAACTVGPDYRRPAVDLPEGYAVEQSPVPAAERWWTLFQDPVLDRLVDEALAGNADLLAAAERVEQARAIAGLARADQFPNAGIDAGASRNRASEQGAFPLPPEAIETSTYRAALRASWELDFWGRYRRATEAARAELAASEFGRLAVRASLVAEVSRGYFALRALDRRLETAESTREGRGRALELQKLRLDAGAVSEIEYRQIESDLRGAEALVPIIRQNREQQRSALAVLLGRTPREIFGADIARGDPATPAAIEVPAGLPSDLLLRRPDVRAAEERLRAANARIGVARAAYFPSITLTGAYGGESQTLGDLFSPAARTWSVAGGLLQPLLTAGRIQSGVDLADAQAREAALAYRKAIANAFREVRDAIQAQGNARETFAAQQRREQALARTFELARLRYDNGAIGLFEVLETERQLFAARLDAIDAERARRAAIVDLYLALGA